MNRLPVSFVDSIFCSSVHLDIMIRNQYRYGPGTTDNEISCPWEDAEHVIFSLADRFAKSYKLVSTYSVCSAGRISSMFAWGWMMLKTWHKWGLTQNCSVLNSSNLQLRPGPTFWGSTVLFRLPATGMTHRVTTARPFPGGTFFLFQRLRHQFWNAPAVFWLEVKPTTGHHRDPDYP